MRAYYPLGPSQPELRRLDPAGRGASGSGIRSDGQLPARDLADAAWPHAWHALAARNWWEADRRLHRCLSAQPDICREALCHLLRGIAARNHEAPYATSTAHLLTAHALFRQTGDRQGERTVIVHLAAGALHYRRREVAARYRCWLGEDVRELGDGTWHVRSLCMQALMARALGDGSADTITRTALASRSSVADPGVQALLSLTEGERALVGGWLEVACRCAGRAQAWNSLALRGWATACEERDAIQFALCALDLEVRRWLTGLRDRVLQRLSGGQAAGG